MTPFEALRRTDPVANSLPQNAWRDGAQWPAVATFVVPGWPSGLYLARVQTTGASPLTVDLPFLMRAPSGSETGTLLVLSDTTQYAYNDWGGRGNAYGYVSNNDFAGAYPSTSAFRVPLGFPASFERPLHGGFGNVLQSWEIPFIQWLERAVLGSNRDRDLESCEILIQLCCWAEASRRWRKAVFLQDLRDRVIDAVEEGAK